MLMNGRLSEGTIGCFDISIYHFLSFFLLFYTREK